MSERHTYVKDEDPEADVIIAWPYFAQLDLPSGTRIDLKCEVCSCRVCLNQHSQRFLSTGAKVYCRACGVALGFVDPSS